MFRFVRCLCFVFAMICVFYAEGGARNCQDTLYSPGEMLKPVDSALKVAQGDQAIGFSLPSISGKKVSLSDYLGEKNIVLAFIPAAWTPVCSDQIYEYTFYEDYFREQDAVLLVISTGDIPTLFAWTRMMMNVWFPVLSDSTPPGEVSGKYGVKRSTGISERAVFIIDRRGLIRYIDVHDINEKPDINTLLTELKSLNK